MMTIPTPMLKVRNISASATLPISCISLKTGSTGHVPRAIWTLCAFGQDARDVFRQARRP